MAGIKRNDKQYDALQKVNDLLGRIRQIDKLVGTDDALLLSHAFGKRTVSIPLDDKETEAARKTLSQKRSRFVKEVLSLTQKYDLELSDQEARLLRNEFFPSSDSSLDDEE